VRGNFFSVAKVDLWGKRDATQPSPSAQTPGGGRTEEEEKKSGRLLRHLYYRESAESGRRIPTSP
jgi:hypothetical protein